MSQVVCEVKEKCECVGIEKRSLMMMMVLGCYQILCPCVINSNAFRQISANYVGGKCNWLFERIYI